MFIYPNRLLFLFFLITGTLISITSYSWFAAWMGMELNLLTFIPILSLNSSKFEQNSLKYFLTQAWASLLMFLIISSFNYFIFYHLFIFYGLCTTLAMKIGSAPFHFWVPMVCSGSSWSSIFILLTWQKIAPLILINTILHCNFLILFFSSISAMFGGIMGINQTNLRSLIAFSSINHLGWMLVLSSLNFSSLMTYFSIYTLTSFVLIFSFYLFNLFSLKQLINLNYSSSTKLMIFVNLLSLGGLPPFLGFLPKWFSLMELISLKFYFMSFVLVISSLFSLYYYLRMGMMIFMLTSHGTKWNIKNFYPNPLFINSTFLLFSLMNFLFYPVFFML